jgi:hypothetical protein
MLMALAAAHVHRASCSFKSFTWSFARAMAPAALSVLATSRFVRASDTPVDQDELCPSALQGLVDAVCRDGVAHGESVVADHSEGARRESPTDSQ